MLSGLYSLSRRPSYRQIWWSLEAARLDVINDHISLNFDRYLGITAAEMPVKFQNDTTNVVNASMLYQHKTIFKFIIGQSIFCV